MLGRIFVGILLCVSHFCSLSNLMAQPRVTHSLNGEWELRIEGQVDWRTVQVPETFESQIAIDFDGVATLKKTIEPIPVDANRDLLLHFDGVATRATVSFCGQPVGEHLGAWTPFRFDVTEIAKANPDGPWTVEVHVDELVGHNTQGFLPIIAPHFGGIWQGVKLIDAPTDRIDDLSVSIHGDRHSKETIFGITFEALASHKLQVRTRKKNDEEWMTPFVVSSYGTGSGREKRSWTKSDRYGGWDTDAVKAWSPDDPVLYEMEIRLETSRGTDTVVVPFAYRSIETSESRFVLNGQTVNFRGLLNWGYAPPRTAPSLDEEFMRSEIQFAKDRGFNMMKFCLWIPPKRYLELCDEMGMMAWIEYPTWHPDFSEKHLENLIQEYDEFFAFDRNHPSVVLRSLTCETGPSADLKVIQALYDQCKDRIPGAIVVDDSSWIAWNRVFDFYDDHPYGNNHTWVDELGKLKEFIGNRPTKPLMLGEAITADTWTNTEWFPQSKTADDWRQPNFLEPSRVWAARQQQLDGEDVIQRITEDSKTYAMLMRKYQMETFRREVPKGGYVVSVIRDMPKASMGLIDYRGRPKWQPEDWFWHRNEMLLLRTDDDRRSYFSGDGMSADLIVARNDSEGSKFAPVSKDELQRIDVTLQSTSGEVVELDVAMGENSTQGPTFRLTGTFPVVVDDALPQRWMLRAVYRDASNEIVTENSWPVWVMPNRSCERVPVFVHDSVSELLGRIKGFPESIDVLKQGAGEFGGSEVLLTSIVDESVLDWMENGGDVVLLANNQPNSFPLQSHWFLRGGPVVSSQAESLFGREMLVHLQHFDLAAAVIRDIGDWSNVHPLLTLWEAHDLDHIKTNGLLFQLPVKNGTLIVSALKHGGETNAAGSFVLQKLLSELADGDLAIRDEEAGHRNYVQLTSEIRQRKVMLDQLDWKFQPDADQVGVTAEWYAREFDDSGWSDIKIDRHWESQGHDQLDNWAWYRLPIEVPEDWNGEKVYLNFTGVDDYYDVYINGQKAGSAGDIEKRETAFELRTSHDITEFVEAGQQVQIAIAVYDWYGAGGIFRPTWLSTQPLATGQQRPRMLK